MDDKNNIEYRAIKRYRGKNYYDEWKITTIIHPIERDIKYRSEVLKLYCDNCSEYHHCNYNDKTGKIYCDNCNNHIQLEINNNKSIYGITKTHEHNKCSVCGSEVNSEGICSFCGINKEKYDELINYFKEEELNYEE